MRASRRRLLLKGGTALALGVLLGRAGSTAAAPLACDVPPRVPLPFAPPDPGVTWTTAPAPIATSVTRSGGAYPPVMARRRRSGPPDEPVELVRLPDTAAQIVSSRLRDEGIDAQVFASGSAVDLVNVQFAHGSRVMVRRDALDTAEALLATWDAADAEVDAAELDAQARAAGDTDAGDGAVV